MKFLYCFIAVLMMFIVSYSSEPTWNPPKDFCGFAQQSVKGNVAVYYCTGAFLTLRVSVKSENTLEKVYVDNNGRTLQTVIEQAPSDNSFYYSWLVYQHDLSVYRRNLDVKSWCQTIVCNSIQKDDSLSKDIVDVVPEQKEDFNDILPSIKDMFGK